MWHIFAARVYCIDKHGVGVIMTVQHDGVKSKTGPCTESINKKRQVSSCVSVILWFRFMDTDRAHLPPA